MKNTITFKIICLCLLLLTCLSVYPKKVEAPPQSFYKIAIPEDYFVKSNHTFWISYLISDQVKRKIGITVNPPFYWELVTAKKVIRPYLFGEIEIKGSIKYKDKGFLLMECFVVLFSNQDSALFVKFANQLKEGVSFEYQISYEDENATRWNKKEIYPFRYTTNRLQAKSSFLRFDPLEGNITKGEPYLLQTLRYDQTIQQIFKGPIFIYRSLGNGMQEKLDRFCYSEVSSKEGIIQINNQSNFLSGEKLEDWLFFSSNQLMSINSAVTKKILQNLDFYKLKRFSRDGFYYLSSGEGNLGENLYTYYWDYSMYGARSILEYYYQGDQTLFYNIAILSYLSLSRNRNPNGYWSNQTISKWLMEEYEFSSDYFDTRFNVDAGIFLLEIYQKFSIPYALTMSEKIGNILQVMMQNGKAYPTIKNGYLLQDYDISYLSKVKTHSSLNHVLNEISFFILLYNTTGKEEYFYASQKLLKGVQSTEEQWKNYQTGDLFYCLFPDGRFGRTDYETLTYHDLIRVRRLLKTTLRMENPSIENLGSYKEIYLVKKGMIKNRKFRENNQ